VGVHDFMFFSRFPRFPRFSSFLPSSSESECQNQNVDTHRGCEEQWVSMFFLPMFSPKNSGCPCFFLAMLSVGVHVFLVLLLDFEKEGENGLQEIVP
jgi:hypothetical protein